jgi:hypothetical protein
VLAASKEVGVDITAENAKYEYMLMLCHQNAGQNRSIKTDIRSFEKFIYFGMTLSNQNGNHEEIKSRLNFGSAAIV